MILLGTFLAFLLGSAAQLSKYLSDREMFRGKESSKENETNILCAIHFVPVSLAVFKITNRKRMDVPELLGYVHVLRFPYPGTGTR
jgi:hypothetical protein